MNEETLTEGEQQQEKPKKKLLSKELHAAIIAHPDYRVCWKIPGNNDAMRPLKYVFSSKTMLFEEDFTATQFHPHGRCRSILELTGAELPEQMNNECVKIKGSYVKDWENAYKCRKISYDHDAKWILLWTDEQ